VRSSSRFSERLPVSLRLPMSKRCPRRRSMVVSRSVRRFVISAICTTVMVGAPAAMYQHRARSERLCERTAAWAAAHAASLPSDLAGLEEYPLTYRRAILGAMTGDQRAKIVREHLDRWIGRASTAGQKDALVDARNFVTGAIYEHSELYRDRAKVIEARVVAAFGKPTGRQILATVGDARVRPFGSFQAAGLFLSELLRGSTSVSAVVQGNCECSTTDDWCNSPYNCTDLYPPCNGSSFGCGSFGLFSCDGICWDPPNQG